MNEKQRQHLEERLLEERERALEALAQFDEDLKLSERESDGDLTAYPLHMADEGTQTEEREKQFLLASKEGRLLYWIDDALQTLYGEAARFGRCQECDREISMERLEVVPWARLCIDCQRGEEAGERRAA